MIKIKRAYEKAEKEDGIRILVDRLWPRGLDKESLKIDEWMREIAPSDKLRKWFAHDPVKWEEFSKRYRKELEYKKDLIEKLKIISRDSKVTLIYSAKDEEHNQAIVLRDLINNKEED